ncbi:MAG: lysophospholipid acyltransferase family protein [Campylobacterota bacterium]|nr:lysophospholipid acyltransferase family protein [Campylobacterota bacterium]
MIDKIRAMFTIVQMMITISIIIILMYIFRKNNGKKVRYYWSKMQMKLMGIKLDIEGEIDNEADMLIINHQSLLDIIILEYLHKKDLVWVAKKEISNLFLFGHIIKAPNMIEVERESKTSLVKLLKDVKEQIKQKRVISIFPEGTRTNGKKLRKFKVGAKLIAEKNNLNVQPIIIVGSREILDSQKIKHKPGVVKIICLPTVKAERKTTWYEECEKDMNDVLNKNIDKNDI